MKRTIYKMALKVSVYERQYGDGGSGSDSGNGNTGYTSCDFITVTRKRYR